MRRFLISYYGVDSNGQNFIGSCITKLRDGEKMTANQLDRLMEEAKKSRPDSVNTIIPLGVSELEVEEDESNGAIPN